MSSFEEIISQNFELPGKTFLSASPCQVENCDYDSIKARATVLAEEVVIGTYNIGLILQMFHAHQDQLWAEEIERAFNNFLSKVNAYIEHAGFGEPNES